MSPVSATRSERIVAETSSAIPIPDQWPNPSQLLLLPGTLCDARLFAPVLERLGPCSASVVDLTGAASAAQMARNLLADAPEQFALIGFSLGGIVALEMVAQAPARICCLALIDTTARPDRVLNSAARRRALATARKEGIDSFILRSWDTLVAPENRGRTDLLDIILAMARDGGTAALADQTEIAINRVDSRSRLARISVPTLVLTGAADVVCRPEVNREIADAIPGAAFFTIAHAGHFAPLENPAAVAFHLRRWLGLDAERSLISERRPA